VPVGVRLYWPTISLFSPVFWNTSTSNFKYIYLKINNWQIY
jgi:hypothetical protein